MPRRRAADPPVLHPARRPAAAPLPTTVPLLAGLGLTVLLVCTLPAVHAQRRLESDHARLAREARAAEARVQSLERELRGGPRQRYLRIKATRALLHRGAGYVEERDRRLRRER